MKTEYDYIVLVKTAKTKGNFCNYIKNNKDGNGTDNNSSIDC